MGMMPGDGCDKAFLTHGCAHGTHIAWEAGHHNQSTNRLLNRQFAPKLIQIAHWDSCQTYFRIDWTKIYKKLGNLNA